MASDVEPPRFSPVNRSTDDVDGSYAERTTSKEVAQVGRLAQTLGELAEIGRDAALIATRGRDAYRTNRETQLAAEAVLTHLGETISRLPASYRDANLDVSWPAISGMRNRVVHAYHLIDIEVLWEAIASDIPTLLDTLGISFGGSEEC